MFKNPILNLFKKKKYYPIVETIIKDNTPFEDKTNPPVLNVPPEDIQKYIDAANGRKSVILRKHKEEISDEFHVDLDDLAHVHQILIDLDEYMIKLIDENDIFKKIQIDDIFGKLIDGRLMLSVEERNLSEDEIIDKYLKETCNDSVYYNRTIGTIAPISPLNNAETINTFIKIIIMILKHKPELLLYEDKFFEKLKSKILNDIADMKNKKY